MSLTDPQFSGTWSFSYNTHQLVKETKHKSETVVGLLTRAGPDGKVTEFT